MSCCIASQPQLPRSTSPILSEAPLFHFDLHPSNSRPYHNDRLPMSARTHLLDLALPLLKNHSFTRQTLRLAASQYLHQTGSSSTSQTDKAEAVEDAKVDSFLNTLLPPSPGAEQVLGEHFAAAGMKAMTSASAVSSGSIQSNAGEGSRSAGNTGSSDELRNLLSERLRFSEELAGEHLVEVSPFF